MSEEAQAAEQIPVHEQDGSLDAAASLMSDDMVGGWDEPAKVRSGDGKFAKADASGEPDPVGDNDKPIKADAEPVDDEDNDGQSEDEPDDDDIVEIAASEEGADPVRYKLTELVESHKKLTEVTTELERARQAQPLPSDYEIAVQETVAERNKYAQALEQWAQYNPVGNPPATELLNENSQHYNPGEYYQQLQAYEHRVQQHRDAKAEHDALMKQNQEDQAKVFNSKLLRARDKISEFWPELKDPAENQRVRQELAQHYGITDERLATITDPDAYRVMKDALAFKRGESKRPQALKAVTAKPKLVPAKARQATKSAKAQKAADARNRLSSSHSLDDAAEAMGDFL